MKAKAAVCAFLLWANPALATSCSPPILQPISGREQTLSVFHPDYQWHVGSLWDYAEETGYLDQLEDAERFLVFGSFGRQSNEPLLHERLDLTGIYWADGLHAETWPRVNSAVEFRYFDEITFSGIRFTQGRMIPFSTSQTIATVQASFDAPLASWPQASGNGFAHLIRHPEHFEILPVESCLGPFQPPQNALPFLDTALEACLSQAIYNRP